MRKTTYAGYSLCKKTKSVNTLTLLLDLEIICYVSTAQLRRLLFQTQGNFFRSTPSFLTLFEVKIAANNG